jgi:sugar lactone lactonase YvrE
MIAGAPNPGILSGLSPMGGGLVRPECVLATASGDIFASDGRGGVSKMRPDGSVELILAKKTPKQFLVNGIALLPDRSLLLANIEPDGGVWRLMPDGSLAEHLVEFEGKPLPVNFVGVDHLQRLWITVSTFVVPRTQAFCRGGAADGVIIVMDRRGARIVADGLSFTNEAKVDPSGRFLYVNETVGRRLNRYEIAPDGALRHREVVAEFGSGHFPDGLAFDAEGGVWVTSVVSNRITRVDPGAGRSEIMFEDADLAHVDTIEKSFQAGIYRGADAGPGRLGCLSSLAFGGPDLRTLYFGSIFETRLFTARSPYPGVSPPHWTY